MWPDRVSNPGPLTYESGALPTALHGPACVCGDNGGGGGEISNQPQEFCRSLCLVCLQIVTKPS